MARKKKLSSPNLRQSEVNKLKRAKGQEYTNRSGIVKPEKKFLDPKCDCKYKCWTKISSDKRQRLFTQFHQITELAQKKLFILSMIEAQETKKKTVKDENRKKSRHMSVEYTLRSFTNNVFFKPVKVCKKYFAETFGLCLRVINRWIISREPGDLQHKSSKVGGKKKADASSVIAFLETIEFYESHYGRQTTNDKRMLKPGYTIKRLYMEFVSYCESMFITIPMSEKKFYEFIQLETNVTVHIPIKDSCGSCDRLQALINFETDTERLAALKMEKSKHLEKADLARQMMQNDINNACDEIIVFMFDLQKALPLPVITSGQYYYKRKFYLYNLGIHAYPEDHGYMYTWPEDQGSKGSCEVSSAVKKFLRKNAAGVKHVITYSDNCSGQNKNIKIVAALLSFICDPMISIELIDMKFLTTGHSFMACDRDFGKIERKIHEQQNIYSLGDYYDAIVSATNNPFILEKLTFEDFDNIDEFLPHITNRKKNTNKQAINWHHIAWIRLSSSKPFEFQYKTSLSENEDFLTVDISKKRAGINSLFDVSIPKKYPTERGISELKKKNLVDLTQFLPSNCRSFFLNLKSSSDIQDEE